MKKKINRILKKIETKESEINEITQKLQSMKNFDDKYNQIIENLRYA